MILVIPAVVGVTCRFASPLVGSAKVRVPLSLPTYSAALLHPTTGSNYIILHWEMLLLLGYHQLTPCSIFRRRLGVRWVGEGMHVDMESIFPK